MKSRRGLSTLVGIVFFMIVFAGVATYVTYSMNQLDKFGQTIIEKNQDDRNRSREQFEVTAVSRDSNKFNITIQNTGELPLNITRLWIQNKTDPSWGTQKFDINKAVTPGQTLTKVGQDLQLVALDTEGYDIRLTTERGNAKEFSVNSVSQEPVYLQLFILPSNVPSGSNTTLLFAVTNNMSNNGALTNFSPNLNPTPLGGGSYTLMSGPEPAIYPLLEKGDTAYFQWVYKISGSSGQGVRFDASLVNGYLANSVSKDVIVIASSGSKDASAYHRTGSTVWYSSNTYSSSPTTTQAATANVLRVFPFIVGNSFTADRIQFETTTTVNSLCNVGIYNSDSNLYPSTLLVDGGQKNSTNAGLYTTSISTALSSNTLYWLAYNCNAAPVFRAIPATDIPNVLGWSGASGANTQGTGWTVARTYASTLPASFPPVGGTILTNTNATLIILRAQ